MSTYLLTFRPSAGYAPSADTFGAWAGWQAGLGARLKDRGNPGFERRLTAATLEAPGSLRNPSPLNSGG